MLNKAAIVKPFQTLPVKCMKHSPKKTSSVNSKWVGNHQKGRLLADYVLLGFLGLFVSGGLQPCFCRIVAGSVDFSTDFGFFRFLVMIFACVCPLETLCDKGAPCTFWPF